jgi:16S rRNA (cytosine967-C5)-methyltransferase
VKTKSRNSVSAARAAAFDILLRVERESSYASELLHSHTYHRLTTVDHALATELVMGVLRWQSLLDSQISESSAQPLSKLDLEVLIALRLAVYQLGWLTRVPARAAINESVELVKRARKRSAAPFVNAVLRKLSARVPPGEGIPQRSIERSIDQSSAQALAASSAHPLWLVERWTQSYGLDSAIRICQHDQSTPVTTIRLRHPEAEEQLRAEGIELAPGAMLNSARRIRHGDVAGSNTFRAGLCVIQDEASQLVAALVGQGANVLDCCAAPGGKTAAISDLNPNANITAIDLHPHRARLMRKLLDSHRIAHDRRAGNIRIVAADACSLPFAAKFDRVLADVPCSGTGTLARNPEIKWRITPNDLGDLQARQISILRAAMAQVATGGRLIYSTCSLEREENEEVIERALAEKPSFRVIDCAVELKRLQQEGELIYADPSSLTRGPYLRTLPGVQPCDGFFAAILKESNDLESENQ